MTADELYTVLTLGGVDQNKFAIPVGATIPQQAVFERALDLGWIRFLDLVPMQTSSPLSSNPTPPVVARIFLVTGCAMDWSQQYRRESNPDFRPALPADFS